MAESRAGAPAATGGEAREPRRHGTLALTLLALGVVYGDIGTSPIYTIGLFFGDEAAFQSTPRDVLGLLSLIFWSLTSIVTFYYVFVVLRVDNRGEGGVMALLALALRGARGRRRTSRWLALVGLVGVALFFADSVVTPAISVISAMEGLQIASPALAPYVLPLAAVILGSLFAVQSHGTAKVGFLFGPIILVWFGVLAFTGARMIVQEPGVLAALNPLYAFDFLFHHAWAGILSLSLVVLCITGCEALYADLGHFGRRPIALGWLAVAYPALVLNYFGQGALILHDPAMADHPFFYMVPEWALLPMIGLTTMATIIASQAVISGAFSISRQAMQLGYLPRLRVHHTSESIIGQIFVPRVNLIMLVLVLALVFWFGSSESLAAVYGVAVTGTMLTTCLMAASVYLERRLLAKPLVVLLFGAIFVIEFAFFATSSTKLISGGFLPILMGLCLLVVMLTWQKGRSELARRQRDEQLSLEAFLARVTGDHPPRVGGTAVYLTAEPDGVPHALLHNLKHNKVLHERVVLLSVRTEDVPRVGPDERIAVTPLGKRFYRVVLSFGFFEQPDVPQALSLARAHGLEIEMADTSFFLGRQKLVPSLRSTLPRWQERLFIGLARNAENATDYFRLPTNRVVELGAQMEI